MRSTHLPSVPIFVLPCTAGETHKNWAICWPRFLISKAIWMPCAVGQSQLSMTSFIYHYLKNHSNHWSHSFQPGLCSLIYTENRQDHILPTSVPFTNTLTFECLIFTPIFYAKWIVLSMCWDIPFFTLQDVILYHFLFSFFFGSISFNIQTCVCLFHHLITMLPWPAQKLSTHLFLQQIFIEHLLYAKHWTCISLSPSTMLSKSGLSLPCLSSPVSRHSRYLKLSFGFLTVLKLFWQCSRHWIPFNLLNLTLSVTHLSTWGTIFFLFILILCSLLLKFL